MNKKAYIKPTIEVVEMETEAIMTGSLVFKDGEVDTSQEGTQLSNSYRPGRRGTWGNLWAQDEE